jgi:membrane-associated phospholipid phosphatase
MDEAMLLAINGLRTPALDPVIGFLGSWGYLFFPLILSFWMVRERSRAALRDMLDGWLALLLSLFWVESLFKPLVGRARPSSTASLEDALHVLGRASSSPSFPSGTATACAAAVAWIWLRHSKGTTDRVVLGLTALFGVIVSLARVYAGAHWPSDIAAGWICGLATAYAIDRATRPSEGGKNQPSPPL